MVDLWFAALELCNEWMARYEFIRFVRFALTTDGRHEQNHSKSSQSCERLHFDLGFCRVFSVEINLQLVLSNPKEGHHKHCIIEYSSPHEFLFKHDPWSLNDASLERTDRECAIDGAFYKILLHGAYQSILLWNGRTDGARQSPTIQQSSPGMVAGCYYIYMKQSVSRWYSIPCIKGYSCKLIDILISLALLPGRAPGYRSS